MIRLSNKTTAIILISVIALLIIIGIIIVKVTPNIKVESKNVKIDKNIDSQIEEIAGGKTENANIETNTISNYIDEGVNTVSNYVVEKNIGLNYIEITNNI